MAPQADGLCAFCAVYCFPPAGASRLVFNRASREALHTHHGHGPPETPLTNEERAEIVLQMAAEKAVEVAKPHVDRLKREAAKRIKRMLTGK